MEAGMDVITSYSIHYTKLYDIDVLYAPGLTTLEQVRTVCGALGKPVNVLAPPVKGATLAALAEAGAKRLSVGGALARAAIGALRNNFV